MKFGHRGSGEGDRRKGQGWTGQHGNCCPGPKERKDELFWRKFRWVKWVSGVEQVVEGMIKGDQMI